MNFTFGIITNGDKDLSVIIDSIEKQNIPGYEIIIVGGNNINRKNTIFIPFIEKLNFDWITKKKNIITENAKYENIVYMHDYVKLEDDWYDGFLKFGDNFKICMNKILDQKGNRYRDWVLWYEDLYGAVNGDSVSFDDISNIIRKAEVILPYDIKHLSKYMYISGTYWVAKKNVMQEIKLNEKLHWGQGEEYRMVKKIKTKI